MSADFSPANVEAIAAYCRSLLVHYAHNLQVPWTRSRADTEVCPYRETTGAPPTGVYPCVYQRLTTRIPASPGATR